MESNQGVSDHFKGNGIDQEEYLEVLNDLYANYAQSDEYLSMSKQQRTNLNDRYKEVWQLIRSVFRPPSQLAT